MTFGKKNTIRSFENISVCSSSAVYEWGTTLVVATHLNDEVMGCGGAIALLRQMGYRVHVLFVCDGSKSPFKSTYLPPKCRKDLCKYEAECALSVLGVDQDSITYLEMKDAEVPFKGEKGFKEVVHQCQNKIAHFIPDTVLLPWQVDGNRDCQALKQIMLKALQQAPYTYNLVEYSLVPWMEDDQWQRLLLSKNTPWLLDNKAVLEKKVEALSQYHIHEIELGSELVIKDELLNSTTLSHFTHPWEIYFPASY